VSEPELADDGTGYENGERVPISPVDSGGELIEQCAARCSPTLTFDQAAQALQFYDQNFSSNDAVFSGSLSEALREQSKKIHFFYEKVFDLLCNYQAGQKNPKMLKMSTCAMALALGLKKTAGAPTGSALARRLGLKRYMGESGKQTVNKCLQKFIRQLKLSKAEGQRDESARSKMRITRLQQLNQNGNGDHNGKTKKQGLNGHLSGARR
jgi:hypothetical protein